MSGYLSAGTSFGPLTKAYCSCKLCRTNMYPVPVRETEQKFVRITGIVAQCNFDVNIIDLHNFTQTFEGN